MNLVDYNINDGNSNKSYYDERIGTQSNEEIIYHGSGYMNRGEN